MLPRFDRLFVCLPHDAAAIEPLLAEAARVAQWFPQVAVEVVAAPAHGLHDRRREAVSGAFGRAADAIHLVPSPVDAVDFAVSLADRSSLVITDRSHRRPAKERAANILTVGHARDTGAVLAVVEPEHDTTAAVALAIDIAERMGVSRVIAADVYFDEAAIACDHWEQRVFDERAEQLGILLARVPYSDTVAVESRLVQSPDRDRAIQRIVDQADVALVVGVPCSSTVSTLTLPEALRRREAYATGLRGKWNTLLDRVAAAANPSRVPFEDATGA